MDALIAIAIFAAVLAAPFLLFLGAAFIRCGIGKGGMANSIITSMRMWPHEWDVRHSTVDGPGGMTLNLKDAFDGYLLVSGYFQLSLWGRLRVRREVYKLRLRKFRESQAAFNSRMIEKLLEDEHENR